MRRNPALLSIIAVIFFLLRTGAASAQCTVPNQLTNGQTADATQVMGNFNAVINCMESPTASNFQYSGPGGGIVTVQNPSATTNYNFNLPASAGDPGDVLTSGGGGSNPNTWTPTGSAGHALPYLDGNNSWSGTQTFGPVVGAVTTQSGATYTLAATDFGGY